MKTITLTLAIVVGLFLSASPAAAQTINACVKQTNGRVRIVGVPGQCKSNEAAVSWNVEGAQGAAGPQGPQGDAAPEPPRFELVGFTSATFQGDAGVLGFTAACQAQFGPGTRMCSSVEVMETTTLPSGLTGEAWVRPVLTDGLVSQNGSTSFLLDASGVMGRDFPPDLSCKGWSKSTGGPTGLFVNATGQFRPDSSPDGPNCNFFKAVACCAPAP